MMFAIAAGVLAVLAPDGAPKTDAPKLDPVQLVLGATLPVKTVMAILVAFSIVSWLVIFMKSLHVARARVQSKNFLRALESAGSMQGLAVEGISAFRGSPFARIFATAHDEMMRLTNGNFTELSEPQATHVTTATRRAAAEEVSHLESWMMLLGTIGSTAPFIGLFGTVWGIMDAFLSIGNQQSANLPVVAPHIAEALIATAVGLVAAIPSVMGYNYFVRRVGEIGDTMEGFADDVAARARLGGV